jgi:hypothetical protein
MSIALLKIPSQYQYGETKENKTQDNGHPCVIVFGDPLPVRHMKIEF